MNREEENPNGERQSREASISYAGLSRGLIGVLASFVGVLLWQVWINTSRITVIEEKVRQHEQIDTERLSNLTRMIDQRTTGYDMRFVSMDKLHDELRIEMRRVSDKQDQMMTRLEAKLDQLAEEVRRKTLR